MAGIFAVTLREAHHIVADLYRRSWSQKGAIQAARLNIETNSGPTGPKCDWEMNAQERAPEPHVGRAGGKAPHSLLRFQVFSARCQFFRNRDVGGLPVHVLGKRD